MAPRCSQNDAKAPWLDVQRKPLCYLLIMKCYSLMPLRLQPIWTHSFNNYVLAAPWTSSVLGSRERVNLTGSFPIVPTVSTLFPRCSLGFPNLVSLVSLFPDGSDPSSSSHHTTTDEPCRPSPLKLFLVSLVPMCFCGTYHFQSCILASFYNSDYSKYS